jgi:1,4-alpha-glucan branching enzyme
LSHFLKPFILFFIKGVEADKNKEKGGGFRMPSNTKKGLIKLLKSSPVKKTNGKVSPKDITFKFLNPACSSVSLVGDFNNWKPGKLRMKKVKKGEFVTKLSLKPGRYTYKYLTDQGWFTDPNADFVYDSMGNQNSMVAV